MSLKKALVESGVDNADVSVNVRLTQLWPREEINRRGTLVRPGPYWPVGGNASIEHVRLAVEAAESPSVVTGMRLLDFHNLGVRGVVDAWGGWVISGVGAGFDAFWFL